MSASFTLKNDMRVGAIGRTRSGKTFLMEKLLVKQPRVIVVDSKHRVRWPGFSLTSDPNAALIRDKVIYRPEEGKPPPNWFWTAAMDALHERGGGIIYLDEAGEVTTANFIPQGLRTVVRLGGELTVAVWWSAQEATSVNNVLLRQSEVLALFVNDGASDRDKIIQNVGDIGEVPAHLKLHEFVIHVGDGEPVDTDAINVYKVTAEEPSQTSHA